MQSTTMPSSFPSHSPAITGMRRHKQDAYEATSYLEYTMMRCSIGSIQCLAGACGGIAASVVACPLDVIKIRLQERNGLRLWTSETPRKRRSFQHRGLIGTGRMLWHEGGLAAMYQGLGPTIVGYIPKWAIFFSLYHKIDDSLNTKFGKLVPCLRNPSPS